MKFNCVMIDFPWQYRDVNTGGGLNSGAKNKYPVMSVDEIKHTISFVQKVCSKECLIFMWGTVPLASDAMEAVKKFEEYGFIYKSKHFWKKKRRKLGMGRDFRNEVEELYILKRGRLKHLNLYSTNWWSLPVGKHSEKPEEFRTLVETWGYILFGREALYLELFARKKSQGWITLGRQLDGVDIRKSLSKLASKT